MTLCRWYCSVAFWAGKPHNNYVNVKICKMPIMRCTHSFPSSIRIGKNTKGFKNLNDLFWQGAAHALGVWTVPSPTQIGSKQPWATGKVVTFVVEMLQKYFWQSKVNNILSLVHCLLQNTFATNSTFQLCKFWDYIKGINHSRQHSQLEIEKYSVLLCDPGSEAAAGVSSNVSHISPGHPDQISSEWIMSLLSHRLQPKDFTSYQILEIFLQKSSRCGMCSPFCLVTDHLH